MDSLVLCDYLSIKINILRKEYRHDVDLLKGIAIISVILYRAGWCKSGYLGGSCIYLDHLFITYDGRHLTPSGCKFYAQKMKRSYF